VIRAEHHQNLATIFLSAEPIITGKNKDRAGASREVRAGWSVRPNRLVAEMSLRINHAAFRTEPEPPRRRPKKRSDYLAFLHKLPCVVTGRTGVQAAHLSYAPTSSTAISAAAREPRRRIGSPCPSGRKNTLHSTP
jgi:hypothetical protein